MQTTLLIVDRFLNVPQVARDAALQCEYRTVRHHGVDYPGVGIPDATFAATRDVIYERIGEAMGFPIKAEMSFFRRQGVKDNEGQAGWIHADNGEAEFAGVYYLNTPEECAGGTAFWEHRGGGYDRVPAYVGAARAGALVKGSDVALAVQEVVGRLRADTNDETKWRHLYTVPMKWNRFIAYPADLFHSRMPKDWVNTAVPRLVFCVFFNRKG